MIIYFISVAISEVIYSINIYTIYKVIAMSWLLHIITYLEHSIVIATLCNGENLLFSRLEKLLMRVKEIVELTSSWEVMSGLKLIQTQFLIAGCRISPITNS